MEMQGERNFCRKTRHYRFRNTSGKIDSEQMNKIALIIGVLFIVIAAGWSFSTSRSLQKPLQEVIKSDNSFNGIVAEVKYEKFLKKDTLIFNLKRVPVKASLVAPLELLLNFLKKMEDEGNKFETIKLQYQGKTRFMMNREAAAILVARTYNDKIENIALDFPQYVVTPGGKNPFIQPSGDPQYVIQKKYHNYEKLVKSWFLDDMKKKGEEVQAKLKEKTGDKKEPSPEKPTAKKAPKDGEIPEIPEIAPEEVPEAPVKTEIETKETETPEPESSPTEEIPAIEPEQI